MEGNARKRVARNPWIAGLLTFVVPGLGQLYNGQWRKWLAISAVLFVLPLGLCAFMMTPLALAAIALLAVLGLVVSIFAFVDAVRTARRIGEDYVLAPYNRVLVYASIVLLIAIGQTVVTDWLRDHRAQAFRIPSESMSPTLLPGDFVFVDRRPEVRAPRRNALVVFRPYERPGAVYIDRVVAMGGERVEIVDKRLQVDGRPLDEPYAKWIDAAVLPASISPRDNLAPLVVPPDHAFLLGDNRDNANDSRFRGPVGRDEMLGPAVFIYWSWDGENGRVRWERLGRRLDVAP
jgi:signal peptidase I